MKYKFIDLFCGAGGFAKGFQMAGFECIGGIDNVKAAVDTHSYNFPNSKSICKDIREIVQNLQVTETLVKMVCFKNFRADI